MTDYDNRIADLEAQVAALTLRDARRESEHHNPLNIYDEVTASRESLRREVEKDYGLLGKSFDELSQRISHNGGDEPSLE
jgi:hypothetical protein